MISYPQPPSWVQERDPLYIIFDDILCSGQVAQKGGEVENIPDKEIYPDCATVEELGHSGKTMNFARDCEGAETLDRAARGL